MASSARIHCATPTTNCSCIVSTFALLPKTCGQRIQFNVIWSQGLLVSKKIARTVRGADWGTFGSLAVNPGANLRRRDQFYPVCCSLAIASSKWNFVSRTYSIKIRSRVALLGRLAVWAVSSILILKWSRPVKELVLNQALSSAVFWKGVDRGGVHHLLAADCLVNIHFSCQRATFWSNYLN